MPYIAGLHGNAKVFHALMYFNTGMERPLLDMQQSVMRSPDSPIEVVHRELLAAYVSALNKCNYCRGVHTACAVEFGAREGLVEELVSDIGSADIDDRLKPLFKFARKLTLEQHNVGQGDADAIFELGWTERALYDVVNVCCIFNFMNRFTLGLGLADIETQFQREGWAIKQGGYAVADRLKLQ